MLFFSRWPGTATAHPPNSGVYSVKEHMREVNVSQTCVSAQKRLIRIRIGLFGDYKGREVQDMPQTLCTTWSGIQTIGFANVSILLIKIGDVRLRE